MYLILVIEVIHEGVLLRGLVEEVVAINFLKFHRLFLATAVIPREEPSTTLSSLFVMLWIRKGVL
jgi:hypothetical protein